MWLIEKVKAILNHALARNGQRHLRSDNIRPLRTAVTIFVQTRPKEEHQLFDEHWCGRAVYINGERRMIKY